MFSLLTSFLHLSSLEIVSSQWRVVSNMARVRYVFGNAHLDVESRMEYAASQRLTRTLLFFKASRFSHGGEDTAFSGFLSDDGGPGFGI
ncbi:hypothetical protein EDD18DRAFT_1220458 [Armillaria luteobubalina]|uniref:Secreted protein n=1 Tax=Armillaria luteobubalina TaxID=153913 RepID=A0AA39NYX8_9AGAR|nr:hypothetical protein EDD18DRAFT_1220458 [Armillaria luteobubalina]